MKAEVVLDNESRCGTEEEADTSNMVLEMA